MPTGDTTQGRAAAIYCNILELHLPRSHGPSSSGITPTVMDEKKPSSASIDKAHSGSATRSDSALPRCKRLSIRPGCDGPRHRAPARCPPDTASSQRCQSNRCRDDRVAVLCYTKLYRPQSEEPRHLHSIGSIFPPANRSQQRPSQRA